LEAFFRTILSSSSTLAFVILAAVWIAKLALASLSNRLPNYINPLAVKLIALITSVFLQ
jgi:hypothetical protein